MDRFGNQMNCYKFRYYWSIFKSIYLFQTSVNFAHRIRARRLILNHQLLVTSTKKYARVLEEQKDKEKEIEIPTDRILLNEGRPSPLGPKNEKDEYLEIAEDLKMFNTKLFIWLHLLIRATLRTI